MLLECPICKSIDIEIEEYSTPEEPETGYIDSWTTYTCKNCSHQSNDDSDWEVEEKNYENTNN